MGLPRIVYNPGGGSRNFNFTEELSGLSGPLRKRSATVNETRGGVVTVQFAFMREEFTALWEGVPRNDAFEEEHRIFRGHAGAGKTFAFAVDSADMVNTGVRVAASAGATRLLVDSSAGFVNGQKYIVESLAENGYAQQVLTLTGIDVASAPSIDFTGSALAFAFAIGDRVRSRDYYPLCVIDQDEDPLSLNEGSSTFNYELRVKTYYDLVTA